MVYRGPGFLTVAFELAPPPPLSSLSRQLNWRHTGRLTKRDKLLRERGERGGGGARSYDGEKSFNTLGVLGMNLKTCEF
jgi:hypothetical protein